VKKQLISTGNLEEWICRASGKVYLDGTKILTAAARDELGKRGVEIVHGPAPGDSACCRANASGEQAPPGMESFLSGVAAILQSRYGVSDPVELEKLSRHVARIVKENL
jgi:hypothetical protein